MKYKISYEGELYEDQDTMKIITHAMDLYCAISEARNEIRSRKKYAENVTDEEYTFLERLQEILWIEGVEL